MGIKDWKLVVGAGLIFVYAAAPAAHDIPNDVTVQTFLKPEGQRLRLLVRAPLQAMRDMDYPKPRGTTRADLMDLGRAESTLRDASTLWIADFVDVYENDVHLGKPDVTEPPPYPSFQPVLDLARFPRVWVKIGDYQIASREPFPWRDTIPFVARLKEAFGPERMIWGTGYAGRARLVPLEQALRYVREELPCLSASDLEQILDYTPRALFGF